MAKRKGKAPPRRIIREPMPSRRKTPPRRRGPLPGSRQRKLPGWVIGLVALACVGVLVLVFTSGDGEPTGPTGSETTGATGSTGATGGTGATGTTGPSNSVEGNFPAPILGERVVLRVVALGDDPRLCTAVVLEINGEPRTAYHHECPKYADQGDVYFFLVEAAGAGTEPVTVRLDGFELVTAGGTHFRPIDAGDLRRRFPNSTTLAVDVSRKGWVLFEAAGATPAHLLYTDGDQTIIVRFPDTWL